MSTCACSTVCRPNGLFEVVDGCQYPAATHLKSCPHYQLERFVRVEFEGDWMILTHGDAEDMQADSSHTYKFTDVFLTRDQFESLPEHAGF